MERVVMGSLLVVCSVFILNSLNDVYANSEGDALYAFKSKLNQDFTGILSDWNPKLINPCTWFHVTCNAADSVTRVDLGNSNLFGELHLNLTNLPNIEILVLSSNSLNGDLNNLILSPNLNHIDLSDNMLSGTISPEFTKLSHLVTWDLSLNNLIGTLPDWHGPTSMMIINLSGNMLSGSVPASWDTVIQNTGLVNLTHNCDASSNKYTICLTGSCTENPCHN